MCRLYAMRANEPTRVECGLVHSQNALMQQSKGDSTGLMHGHGWGVADYPDGVPVVEKQTWAAYHGEHFAQQRGPLPDESSPLSPVQSFSPQLREAGSGVWICHHCWELSPGLRPESRAQYL